MESQSISIKESIEKSIDYYMLGTITKVLPVELIGNVGYQAFIICPFDLPRSVCFFLPYNPAISNPLIKDSVVYVEFAPVCILKDSRYNTILQVNKMELISE